MTAVVLQQLSRRYRDITAVDSLDLEIADKEFVVMLGPSGCGKTTTLNLIAGLDTPTSGDILFDSRPIDHVPPEKPLGVNHYADQLAVVKQDILDCAQPSTSVPDHDVLTALNLDLARRLICDLLRPGQPEATR